MITIKQRIKRGVGHTVLGTSVLGLGALFPCLVPFTGAFVLCHFVAGGINHTLLSD